MHTGEKPFHCSYCEKKFVDPSELKQHVDQRKNQDQTVSKYLCKNVNHSKVTVQFENEGIGQNEIVSHMDRSDVKI